LEILSKTSKGYSMKIIESGKTFLKLLLGGTIGFFFIFLAFLMWYELQTSAFQSKFFSQYVKQLNYSFKKGQSDDISFPEDGPFNKRRGYAQIPEYEDLLSDRGYEITLQSRFSPELVKLVDHGITPPYNEPTITGLIITDPKGASIYDFTKQTRVFANYNEIPPLIVKAILFIEDRQLGDPIDIRSNPVVNWARFAKAGLLYGASKFGFPINVEGGSTLATQLEKYRYSNGGATNGVLDKFRQMGSASLKVYKDGPDTRAARRQIVLDYLNTAPLAAAPSFGEVYGIGEGLYAWFGLELSEVAKSLNSPSSSNADKAKAFKHVLTLLCAVRAPSNYLLQDYAALQTRVSNYIDLFEEEGIIDHGLAEELRKTKVVRKGNKMITPPMAQARLKSVNAVRNELLRTLNVAGYYDLNFLNLEVETTIDTELQEKVTAMFDKMMDNDFIDANGLRGKRLLETGDPKEVIYSFLLYESTPQGNFLRVQADNLDKPFDMNRGMKLELGSTAKLRTIAHYLEVVDGLYYEHKTLGKEALKVIAKIEDDPITQWSAATLLANPTITIDDFLNEALMRKYSESTWEVFFTGGGLHTFNNFNKTPNPRNLPVREGLVTSNNLLFIRLMRDLVRYHKARLPYDWREVLSNYNSSQRVRLLDQIVYEDSKDRLWSYYTAYRTLQSKQEVMNKFLGENAKSGKHLTILFYAWKQGADELELAQWLDMWKGDVKYADLEKLLKAYSNPKMDLADYSWLLKKHPLEIWAVGQILFDPEISWNRLLQKSTAARASAYSWLYKTKSIQAQNTRLSIRIEEDAFARMTPYWQRFGFPFKELVPSYATAIGSSCDRPAALAELMGIIVNDGIRYRGVAIKKLEVAEGTPYYTVFDRPHNAGERVMSVNVARALRGVTKDIVELGTARRLAGSFINPDGTIIFAGGKTGSGDNQVKTFNRYGGLQSATAKNRTATFVFYIGDRHFGVITAFVAGPKTKNYSFTSALPVSILKLLAPTLNEHFAAKKQALQVSVPNVQPGS
jgi:membrane peptidoglycan carboxypeptidase